MQLQQLTWQDYRLWSGAGWNTVSGELQVLPQVHSPQLKNDRNILVWLPPDYHTTEQRYPVIYMHDGQNLFDRATGFAGNEWCVDETMLALSEEGIKAIIVGLPNTSERMQEYNPFPDVWNGHGDLYLNFITDTVKPLVDDAFRTQPAREHTGIMGSSMGGLISLYGFFARPDTFGFAGVMSPSLWVGSGAIYDAVRERPYVDGKIYLDDGSREPSARKMKAALQRHGYKPGHNLLYVSEENGEHNEAAWARRLPNALRFLLA
ncbi:MAG: alpha/beta hydrolase-fold protein [Anaerolineae bacterium]